MGVTTKPKIVPIGIALFVKATDLALSLKGIHLAYRLCQAGKVMPSPNPIPTLAIIRAINPPKKAQGVIKVNNDHTTRPTPKTIFAPILSDNKPPQIWVII